MVFLMLIAHPIRTFAAWATVEVGSIAAFMFSVFALMDPQTQATVHNSAIAASTNPIGLTPQAMMVAAYTSLVTAIFGGVVAVIQVIISARNARSSSENEVLKVKLAFQEQQLALLAGWQRTILNQKPGEPYGHEPTYFPQPEDSTPQAMEHARTLPVVIQPVPVPPGGPVPITVPVPIVGVGSNVGPAILPPDGTDIASDIRNTSEALRSNTEAVQKAGENVKVLAEEISKKSTI